MEHEEAGQQQRADKLRRGQAAPTPKTTVLEAAAAGGLRALATRVSNAGRWGPDDQRGTLNLITPGMPAVLRVEDEPPLRTSLRTVLGERIGSLQGNPW